MQPNDFNRTYSTVTRSESLLSTNTVLRNTYQLLGLSLLFSGFTAYLSAVSGVQPNILVFFIGTYGLMFLTQYLRNSPWGILSVFAFTGFMGYTLGPILDLYVKVIPNGPQIIMMAVGGTGLTFFGLSAYVLTTRKEMSYLAGFLNAGFWALLICVFASIFFHATAFELMISAGFIIFSSAAILFETSNIIHGGERNYIIATITLYAQIYNLFVSLLRILAAFNNRD